MTFLLVDSMDEEYRTAVQRTLDNLHEAQRSIQRTQSYIGTAIKFHALNGSERKLMNEVKLGLINPHDKIQQVIDALKISLK